MRKISIKKKALYLVSVFALLLSFIFQGVALAAPGDDSSEENGVYLHKLYYKNELEEGAGIQNTGKEINLEDFEIDVKAYDVNKYGDLQFSVYKLDKDQIPEGKSPQEIADEVEKDNSLYGASLEEETNLEEGFDGQGVFKILQGKTQEEGYYVIVETKAPKTVTQKAKPIFLALPIMNDQGDGYLQEIHLYTKNQVQEVEFSLRKYAYYNKDENPVELDGAEFDLYKENSGEWEKVNQEPLVTKDNGQIKVKDLTVGRYKFVETNTGKENLLLNPSVVDGEENKLGFTFTKDGEIETEEGSLLAEDKKVVNYEEPALVKNVDKEVVDISEEYNYSVEIDLPKDIQAYKTFSFEDISDNSIEIDKDTIEVEGLQKEEDYSLEDTDKIKIDFKVESLNPGKLKINYKASLKDDAKIGEDLVNTAKITYSNGLVEGEKESSQKVKTYKLEVKKVSGGVFNSGLAREGLEGAEFLLKSKDGKYLQADKKEDSYVVKGFTDKENATKLVSNEEGFIKVNGLKDLEYTLEEIKAPKGYQLKENPETKVKVDENSEVVEIENEKSPNLPLTGLEDSIILIALLAVGLVSGFVIFSKVKKEEN